MIVICLLQTLDTKKQESQVIIAEQEQLDRHHIVKGAKNDNTN